MNENNNKYLLPPGFREHIGDEAEKEFWALEKILSNFAKWSYSKINTSMVEYEDSLFDGNGANLEEKTFKLVDSQTLKTMGIRSDITTQISRIVSSRLSQEDMPLRLCYYGNILRNSPSNTKGDRGLKQVGLELINDSISVEADAETIIIAIESLIEVGIQDISIDLNTPGLINNLEIELDDNLRDALSKRDSSNLPEILKNLIDYSGDAEKAFSIDSSQFTEQAKAQIQHLKNVVDRISATDLPVNITIDFIEDNGFEYHEMIGFSIFSKALRDEIGRGGRYCVACDEKSKKLFATGFSYYLNSFIDIIDLPEKLDTKEVSSKATYQEIKELQKQGLIVKKKLG